MYLYFYCVVCVWCDYRCVCVGVCLRVCLLVWAFRGQRLILGCLPPLLLCIVFGGAWRSPFQLGGLTSSPWDLPISIPSPTLLGLRAGCGVSSFLCGCWDLNSGFSGLDDKQFAQRDISPATESRVVYAGLGLAVWLCSTGPPASTSQLPRLWV